MKHCNMMIACLLAVCSLTACSKQEQIQQEIKPQTIEIDVDKLAEGIPQFAIEQVNSVPQPLEKPDRVPSVSSSGMGWDLRNMDLREFDLSKSVNFPKVCFDLATKWPSKLPADFDPVSIMENGKNPGLGIRKLHEQGITGKGVNIAIIDQGLLLDHKEYKDNVMMYEMLNNYDGTNTSMHGPAVASIAVGDTIGVAPDANLYYIACSFMDMNMEDGTYQAEDNISYMAKAIQRILEINRSMPDDEKIRVISISRGFNDLSKESEKMVYDAIEQAKQEQVLVITTSLFMNYEYGLLGLNRANSKDPDNLNHYSLGSWLSATRVSNETALYVPMDSRTYAGFQSTSDYEYTAEGGLSWTCPWLAGMYALCLQVDPALSPDTFLDLAMATSAEQAVPIDSTRSFMMKIVQPNALIKSIEEQKH